MRMTMQTAARVVSAKNDRRSASLGVGPTATSETPTTPSPAITRLRKHLCEIVAASSQYAYIPGSRYRSIEEYVLEYGDAFVPSPLPERYVPMARRQCYRNAGSLALEHPDLTYVEGFGYRGYFPVLHAWCVDLNGRVIDPTWHWRDRPCPTADMALLGVRIPYDTLVRLLKRYRVWGILDNPESARDLLRHSEWLCPPQPNNGRILPNSASVMLIDGLKYLH